MHKTETKIFWVLKNEKFSDKYLCFDEVAGLYSGSIFYAERFDSELEALNFKPLRNYISGPVKAFPAIVTITVVDGEDDERTNVGDLCSDRYDAGGQASAYSH